MKEEKEDNLLDAEVREAYREKLFGVVRHMNNVNESAALLAERIIKTAESEQDLAFARRLVQRVRSHDLSKLEGMEWKFLHRDEENKDAFLFAIEQHQQSNPHHPEFHAGGISEMNDLHLAEMVCDWKSRSMEMGTDLRTFIKEEATKKYGFSTKTKIYKRIKKYVDLLLDPTF